MMGSGRAFDPMARRLGGRVDLTAFDLPSHGRSDPWQPGDGDPDFHTAVTRVAASFIDRPLDLIGHSMGAVVALRIAVAAPDAIRSLTLIEPVLFAALPAPARDPDGLLGRLAMLAARDAWDEATAAFLQYWDGPVLAALQQSPAVLLIDEVDRADDEFEAFLLEVLSTWQVTIPELGTVSAATAPLVVLTSNRTRELHDALKRRCLYHWIDHPGLDREVDAVGGLHAAEGQAQAARLEKGAHAALLRPSRAATIPQRPPRAKRMTSSSTAPRIMPQASATVAAA